MSAVPAVEFLDVLHDDARFAFGLAPGEVAVVTGGGARAHTACVDLAAGLQRPASGQVRRFGEPVEGPPADSRALGLVLSGPSLTQELSLLHNLRFFGQLFGLWGAALRTAIAQTLERCGLADQRDRRVSQLQGTDAVRAEVARALLHSPRLLLLDPQPGDARPAARAALARDLRDRGAFAGCAVLWTSPDGAEGASADTLHRI